jgi:hypothetical protein
MKKTERARHIENFHLWRVHNHVGAWHLLHSNDSKIVLWFSVRQFLQKY